MAWLTAGLLRPIQPIAEIAESGHDELVFVQPLVDDGCEDVHVRVVALDELAGILPEADAVIVTLPGTAQTRGLFDSALLKLLPPHAALVNVGRGSVVDTGALVAALDAGSLRGAVLDVVDTEPLPAESPLWNRPNVILSPHTAAMTIDEDDRLTALFADNLGRLLNGRPLRNLVDLNAGY
jgi:phosphoglycerate dehydrogenase-like enzyme